MSIIVHEKVSTKYGGCNGLLIIEIYMILLTFFNFYKISECNKYYNIYYIYFSRYLIFKVKSLLRTIVIT